MKEQVDMQRSLLLQDKLINPLVTRFTQQNQLMKMVQADLQKVQQRQQALKLLLAVTLVSSILNLILLIVLLIKI